MIPKTGSATAEYAEILEFAYGLAEQVRAVQHACSSSSPKAGDQNHLGRLSSKMGQVFPRRGEEEFGRCTYSKS